MIKSCSCFTNKLHIDVPLSPLSPSSSTSSFDSLMSQSEIEPNASIQEKLLFAVRNFSAVTSSLFVSHRLPRFDDLIFFNLTTLEGDAYCVELTKKGWRIASLCHDSMNGDYRKMEMFIVYYNTMKELLIDVSPRFERMVTESQLLTPSSSSCCSIIDSESP